jgi:hypothetical protein
VAEYIKKIRTTQSDMQIDYNSLANLPDINNITSTIAAHTALIEQHAQAIEEIKGTSVEIDEETKTLLQNNLKSGVTILGITGTYVAVPVFA